MIYQYSLHQKRCLQLTLMSPNPTELLGQIMIAAIDRLCRSWGRNRKVVELAVVCLPITLSATATVAHNNPKPKNAFIFVMCW
jgi:uncharacterized membrane protein